MFDFDTAISRQDTHAEKYTALKRLYGREDVLPFWVADMEFGVAPAIQKALADRMSHPVYGYTSIPKSLVKSICAWNEKRYDLSVSVDAITLIPGVMSGVSAAILTLSRPGDAIVVQPPLYPPLMQTVQKNGRKLVENQLILENGRYVMDYLGLEAIFKEHQPKIMLLCSPHNPVGRIWSSEELAKLLELTRHHGVYLVSDEIHADIVFPPQEFVSTLSVGQDKKDDIIVLNSASKSFNVAGLNTAYAIIPDSQLRTSLRQQLRRMNFHGVNIFGMVALETAYTKGEPWLDALLNYLEGNRKYMTDTLNLELPELHHIVPEGTYLYWLNFNTLDLSTTSIRETLIDVARIGMNDGITFSQHHGGYWRFNFAVPRSMLEQGLERIVSAFQ